MRKRVPDTTKAKNLIGFQPKIKLDQTIRDIITFYRQ
jgi:nucleoside-diphosphate-sugar epimerase